MTPLDEAALARLRELAEKFKDGASVGELKEYWRAANPATVLALLDMVERQRKALDTCLTGGNHLGTWATLFNWPHFSTPPHEALKHFGATMEYDAWCCWSALMQASKQIEMRAASEPSTEERA